MKNESRFTVLTATSNMLCLQDSVKGTFNWRSVHFRTNF